MKKLIAALFVLATSSAMAGKIPYCEISFTGTTAGNGIKHPMHQSINEKAVGFSYHFEDVIVRADFPIQNLQTGLILIIDRASGNVLSETYGNISNDRFARLESYLKIPNGPLSEGSTYRVSCKEVEEQDPADIEPPARPPRADDYR